jgi:hypothetical protein
MCLATRGKDRRYSSSNLEHHLMVASISIKLDELLILWLWSDTIYKSVMRIIDWQKELNNKRSLSNIPPPLTTTASAAAAADGNIGNLPMTTMGAVNDLGGPVSTGEGRGSGDGGGRKDSSGVRPPLSLHHPDNDVIRECIRFGIVVIAAAGEDVDHLLEGYRALSPLCGVGSRSAPLPDVVSTAVQDGMDQRVIGRVPVCGDLDLDWAAAAIRRGARWQQWVQAEPPRCGIDAATCPPLARRTLPPFLALLYFRPSNMALMLPGWIGATTGPNGRSAPIQCWWTLIPDSCW